MKIRLFTYAAMLFASLTASRSVLAANVEIKNENNKPLGIVIRAEGNPLTENLYWLRDTIEAGATARYEIDASQLGGKETFAVIGETNPLTPSGTCAPLFINQDYKVVYQNNPIGTKCVSTSVSATDKGGR